MNLALSDEQMFLREAARGTLSRFKTLEAAREALDGAENALPDLWPAAGLRRTGAFFFSGWMNPSRRTISARCTDVGVAGICV